MYAQRDYFEDEEVIELYQEVIRASLNDVYSRLELPSSDPSADDKPLAGLARKVVDFERRLARISLPAFVSLSNRTSTT